MPAVTIVLPVYNGSNYLREAVQSVLSQSFDDFELHILDDASSDNSPQIAQSTGDPRVRYSRNTSQYGLFKTLNRAFSESASPLVRIWAHDDIMLPNSLHTFMEFAEEHSSLGMMYCNFFSINATGVRTGREETYLAQRKRTPVVAGSQMSALLFYCFGCLPGNISTVMMKRTAWEAARGFTERLQQAPDYEMWVKVSEHHDIGFIPSKLIELRDHPLQLAKVGQKQMTTIAEELPVFYELERRLNHLIDQRYFRSGWCQQRGRQHMHWICRALLRGDIQTAMKGWRALSLYGQQYRQAIQWLVSLNGRFLTASPEKLFDNLHGLLNRGIQRPRPG